jgi:hypothetical protein
MEIRKGTVRAFDAGPYRATVEVTGSIAVWLTGVPVSRDIAAGDLVTGRSVAVIFFDDANPDDAVRRLGVARRSTPGWAALSLILPGRARGSDLGHRVRCV